MTGDSDSSDSAAHAGGYHGAPHSFWTKYVWSQDHKVIAVQYACTAIAVGLVGLVLSNLMRMQLGFPGKFSFIDANHYYQYVTMHGMIMVIYLLTALFLGGFGNYLIPLMVGARDMVFPFLNMLSYWVYLLAVIVLMVSFFVPGGPTGAAPSSLSACNSDNGTKGTANCVFHNITEGGNAANCVQQTSVLGMPIDVPPTPNCYIYGSGTAYFGFVTVNVGLTSLSNTSYVPAYPAQAGWSFANGLGTVNSANLLKAWKKFQVL